MQGFPTGIVTTALWFVSEKQTGKKSNVMVRTLHTLFILRCAMELVHKHARNVILKIVALQCTPLIALSQWFLEIHFFMRSFMQTSVYRTIEFRSTKGVESTKVGVLKQKKGRTSRPI